MLVVPDTSLPSISPRLWVTISSDLFADSQWSNSNCINILLLDNFACQGLRPHRTLSSRDLRPAVTSVLLEVSSVLLEVSSGLLEVSSNVGPKGPWAGRDRRRCCRGRRGRDPELSPRGPELPCGSRLGKSDKNASPDKREVVVGRRARLKAKSKSSY